MKDYRTGRSALHSSSRTTFRRHHQCQIDERIKSLTPRPVLFGRKIDRSCACEDGQGVSYRISRNHRIWRTREAPKAHRRGLMSSTRGCLFSWSASVYLHDCLCLSGFASRSVSPERSGSETTDLEPHGPLRKRRFLVDQYQQRADALRLGSLEWVSKTVRIDFSKVDIWM